MKWSVLFVYFTLSLFNPISQPDDLDHATLEGIVIDANKNPIEGVNLTARHAITGAERSVITGEDGHYRLSMLTPGAYHLRVEARGFQILRYEGIDAAAGTTVRRNIQLIPAVLEEQITIDASTDTPLVDTLRTALGGTLTRQQIDKLPVETRDPHDLIYTLAGSATPALSDRELAEGDREDGFRRTPEEAGIFSLNGGTPFSNNLTIEGLDNNDDRAARERVSPAIDTVEEVQVITNQFSAEYGRASGGRVNLRLRSGADRYRGLAFYNFRDESLNANSFFRNADPARDRRLPNQNHNFGASIGGPIRRDRLFFFGAYEHDYIYDRTEIAALLPIVTNPAFPLPAPNGANLGNSSLDRTGKTVLVNGGAEVGLYDEEVNTPRLAQILQSRIDLRHSDQHELFVFSTLARNRDERGFPGGRRTLDTLRQTGRDSQSIALSDNLVISSHAVNSARFQFSRLMPADAPLAGNPVVIIDIDDPRDRNSEANPWTRSGRLTTGASTLGGVDRREDRYQFQDTLSYAYRAHTLRIGGDLQLIFSRFIDLEDSTGTFFFATPAGFLANQPSRYIHRFKKASELHNNYQGIYIQDDWRILPNLNLSIGLRWDNETILKDRNNYGPRLSFAWDPFKSNKTAVRAGYGIFYNRALLRTLDDFILTSNATLVDTNNEAAKRLLSELQFPSALSPGDPRIGETGVREFGFIRRLGKDFRIPESYQASFGFERQIDWNSKIEVNYVFNRGLHLWREINANASQLPADFGDFTDYLTSRDFDNRRDPVTGNRPITNTGNADTVRFTLSETPSETLREGLGRVIVFGLNNPSTSNLTSGMNAALAVIRGFRPNPDLTQIEELQSRGNSAYHGVSFEYQRRVTTRGFARVSYTFSKLIDDGVVNTSSPLLAGDFRRERTLSLMDSRHRIAASGFYEFPGWLLRLNLAGTFNFSTSRPFNIGANGNDRNLDDVDNDRPNFTGNLDSIRWRRPGISIDQVLFDSFSLPVIGSSGNLRRNTGRGPNSHSLNLRVSRAFNYREERKFEIRIEVFNPFNTPVFSYGAEFVDYTPSGAGDFLMPRRTTKPRTMRVGLKFEF